MKEQFKKRFWVFVSCEYECGLGMNDFVGSRSTLKAAKRLAQTSPVFRTLEWAAVFDSATGKQYDFHGDWEQPEQLDLFSRT